MNCKSLMCKQLPGYVYELLRSLGKTGDEMGRRIFVVGGFVRDLLMGRPNLDVDVVVEGDGIAFAQAVADARNGRAKCHGRFGTAVLTLKLCESLSKNTVPGSFKIDLATARTEVYDHPGALPSVKLSSVKDDLRRRDFTINAMAIELNENRFGELVDFFDGKLDLESGSVRILHDLSFVDDPTRIFRAVRFEQRYGFSIDPHTEELLERAVAGNFPGTVTKQRLRNEILLILKEDDPVPPIRRMWHFDLMKYMHPHIYLSDELVELLYKAREVLAWWRRSGSGAASAVHDKADAVLLNLMALLDQLDTDEVEDVCERLVLRRRYVDALTLCKESLPKVLQVTREAKGQRSKIYKTLKGLPLEVLLFAMARADMRSQDGLFDSISLYLTCIQRVKPLANGNDLRKLGYAEGPLYSEILDRAFAAQLDGFIIDKNQAMQFIKTQFPLYGDG